MSVIYWWHPRSAEIGEGKAPWLDAECVLSRDRQTLVQARERFEQLCRNGWYGPEWHLIALGRPSWVQVTSG